MELQKHLQNKKKAKNKNIMHGRFLMVFLQRLKVWRRVYFQLFFCADLLFFFQGSDDEDYAQKAPLPPESPMPPPLPPTPDQVIVRKDYDPKG